MSVSASLTPAAQLIARWDETDVGRAARSELQRVVHQIRDELEFISTVRSHTSLEPYLRPYLLELPFTAEVAPALDLRGLDFRTIGVLFQLKLDQARLDYCILGRNGLRKCSLVGTHFNDIMGEHTRLQGKMRRAVARNARLAHANLSHQDATDADFTRAELPHANLQGACLSAANLTQADLRGADFHSSDLTAADLRGANAEGANLLGIAWNPATQVRGLLLRGARFSTDFGTFAEAHGAILT